jgi:hypothetical protein
MSGFSESGAGQYVVVKDPVWKPDQLSGKIGLFDENGDAVVFTTNPPGTLVDLADVTGTPGLGKAPVSDETGSFPLTEVATQAYVDEEVRQALSRWAVLGQKLTFVSSLDEGEWLVTNPSVVLTPDGVTYGPYSDGAAQGGSVRYSWNAWTASFRGSQPGLPHAVQCRLGRHRAVHAHLDAG